MRIHDDVRRDAIDLPRHVLLPVHDAEGSFLAVPRSELVADLRDLDGTHPHLRELEAVLVQSHHHIVNDAKLGGSHRYGAVLSIELGHSSLSALLLLCGQGGCPADDDVIAEDTRARLGEAVEVEFGVVTTSNSTSLVVLGPAEDIYGLRTHKLLLCRVAPVGHRPHEATVHRGLIKHQRVLLVVSRVAHDKDHSVSACGHLAEPQVVHGPRADEGLHGVTHDARIGVHAMVEVRAEDTDGLLPHGRLEDIPRTHVMVREWDDGCADAEDHGGVDLGVRVSPAVRFHLHQIFQEHRNH
mmetsp:Transcript_77725/g.166642  ORF Transcript_77725/g.166642 Transcript_77725/m.166642 type:complete len:298 (-) Transcript_77725:2120-3013(-)